jgi:hypothetical protein
MENYIYLSWIESFAITFYYCEIFEKPFRFQQLLNVINKLNWIDDETINLIFISVLEFGDDSMTIKLFDIFTSKNLLNNYTSFSNLVSKLSPKENYNIEQLLNLPNKKRLTNSTRRSNVHLVHENSMFNIQVKSDYKLKKRTFTSVDNYFEEIKNLNLNNYEEQPNRELEEILFETEDNCMECQKVIKVDTLSLDFQNMKRESLWAQCPHCHNFIIPKLGVKIENSKNEDNVYDPDINMCNEEINYTKVCLYSPYYLKENFKLAILKESGLKLDLKDFIKRYTALFWNLIWYYSLMELPYDFLLPYREESLSPYQVKENRDNHDIINLHKLNSDSNLENSDKNNFSDNKLSKLSKLSKSSKISDPHNLHEQEIILIKQPSNSNYNSNNFSNSKVLNTPPKLEKNIISSDWLNITPSSEFLPHNSENNFKNLPDTQNFNLNEKKEKENFDKKPKHSHFKNRYNLNELQISHEIENFLIFNFEDSFIINNDNSLKTKEFYSSNPETIDLENVDKTENLNLPQSARHLRMNSNSYINPLLLADVNNVSSEKVSATSSDSYKNTPLVARGKMSYDSHHLTKARLHHEFRKKFGKNNSVDVNAHTQKIKFKESNEEFLFHKEE